MAAGTYTLTAVAQDATTSATLPVDHPPRRSAADLQYLLPRPTTRSFTPGSNIPLSATAAASGNVGTIDQQRGVLRERYAARHELRTSPYNFTWNNVAYGSYALTAVATDNLGVSTTSSAINITVDTPPTCTITIPANNDYTPAVTIFAQASAASPSTISQVAFYANDGQQNQLLEYHDHFALQLCLDQRSPMVPIR